jgi:hypothetical protein
MDADNVWTFRVEDPNLPEGIKEQAQNTEMVSCMWRVQQECCLGLFAWGDYSNPRIQMQAKTL